jgi:hypothetical protein
VGHDAGQIAVTAINVVKANILVLHNLHPFVVRVACRVGDNAHFPAIQIPHASQDS